MKYVVKDEVKVELKIYFCIKGFKFEKDGTEVLHAHKRYIKNPTDEEIARFLYNTNSDFVYIEKNYTIKEFNELFFLL